MDPCFPDWNIDSDPPFSNQRKPNPDLMELLYRNGQVVAQSQTHRRPSPSNCCQEPPPKQHQQFHQTAVSFGDSDILGPDTVTASWIEYPVEDSFDKEFSSHFFIETSDAMENDHTQAKQQFEEVLTNPKHPFVSEPLPRTQLLGSFQPNHKSLNFGQFSTHRRHGSAPRFVEQTDVTECSGMTVGSSHCGSNHVQNMQKIVPHEMRKTEIELNVTSSSDGSGSSFGVTNKNSAAMNGLKRKGGDVEDSECQSEDAEQESAGRKKSVQQSGSTTRKSRAAEVHNLSERKRRDRINKKMRALQELIPHCNKTDKASMLDEAIEYLKSLQVQLQMMWMGSAMSPMMFQGMQPYMSPMAMGMGAPHPMSTVHSNMNLRKVPMVDQSMPMAASTPNQTLMSQTPILNPMNFHPMQNQFIPDQFARYMTMHQMQAATNSQPMNMFMFGPQPSQPPQTNAVPVTIMGQHGARTSTTDALSSKIGN